jgi:hypothetical protein
MAEKSSPTEAFIDAAQNTVRAGIDAAARVARESIDASTEAARKVRQSVKDAVAAASGDSSRRSSAPNRHGSGNARS